MGVRSIWNNGINTATALIREYVPCERNSEEASMPVSEKIKNYTN